MSVLDIFKRKLKRKVLVLIGVPSNKQEFDEVKNNKTSDFLKNYKWDDYSETSAKIVAFKKEVSCLGAEVVTAKSIDDLLHADDYDAVVFIAHHIIDTEEVEINGNRFSCDDVIDAFPESFGGVVDWSSCNSIKLQLKLKCRCPKCKIIAAKARTSLVLRAMMCGCTLKAMVRYRDLNYLEAYKKTVNMLLKSNNKSFAKIASDVIYLGNELHSTVFAPKEVQKGTSFMVQVALHRKSESGEVELMAKMIDDSTEIRNAKSLSFKLKKNDKVEFELTSVVNSEFFSIDEDRKSFVWCNEYDMEQFVVTVAANCNCTSFFGKIKIVVNKEPVGSLTFKTDIADCKVGEFQCADISFLPYNKGSVIKKQRDFLIERLKNQMDVISEKMKTSNDDCVTQSLSVELSMCGNCIDIIDRTPDVIYGKIYKVFVSSTSDLEDYRMTLKEQIEKNSMHAEMYENWQQSSSYPRDKCCEQVMSSDVLVCLLGERYGYVEPIWGKSMTEIEYRIAEKKGIPILVYVDRKYKNSKDESQINFINDISTNRLVTFFEDKFNLALQSRSELRNIKNKLDNDNNIRK